MRQLECALQTVMPDSKEPMALHYWAWDQEDDIPDILTKGSITVNGYHFETNPLYQYKFQEDLPDRDSNVGKQQQETTVRFPFSAHKNSEQINKYVPLRYNMN